MMKRILTEAWEKVLPEASENILPEAWEKVLPEASENILPEAEKKKLPEAEKNILTDGCEAVSGSPAASWFCFRANGSLKYRVVGLMICILCISNVVFSQHQDYQTEGVVERLPVFYEKLADRLTFPLSWTHGNYDNFDVWREKATLRVIESLQNPPPSVPFNPLILDEIDRGDYVARKIALNITGDSRVLAYMLLPKTAGPHPAMLLLHDHGARFDIGKEKVIKPWGEPAERLDSAREWVERSYGGRFIGDELAQEGYVVLATDMLNWSDRSGAGAEGQQSLASNLLHLGSSLAGLIAHEDLRAAEFLSLQPEVDSARIGAMGLSVGGFRTWQLAALSPHIAAGVSVCWMATIKGLMVPGNNQTRGQSAFTMLHPGLSRFLDYPDVASLACPKPMMFLAGSRDHLFTLESILDAFDLMEKVWDSQNAGSRLVTRVYDAPHEFNREMQLDALEWLNRVLK